MALLLVSVLVLLTQPPTSWGEEVTTLPQEPLIDNCTLATCSLGRDGQDGKEGSLGEKEDPGSPGETGAMETLYVLKGENYSAGEPGLKGDSGPHDIAALRRQVKALQVAFLQYKKVELFPHGRGVGQKVFKAAGFEKPFQEAEQVCTQAGGQLPSPRSDAENHALQQLVEAENKGNVFLSMTFSKAEGKFTYPGGKPLVYTNWSPGEPNNAAGDEYCVEMYTNGKWNDLRCEEKRLVICEF